MANPPNGYQPGTKSASSRRADFDLIRRIATVDRRIDEIGDVGGVPGPAGPAGATGPAGPTGATGAQGDRGEVGGSLMAAFWQYSATTTAPPSSGQMRTNSPITTLWVAETDTDGFDRSMGLSLIAADSQVLARGANGMVLDLQIIGAPVDNGSYWTFPVSVIRGVANKGSRTQLNFFATAGAALPPGGTDEQVLAKTSSTDYAVTWKTITPIVVKATEPTAADYGLTTIPVGAVWVQSP